MSLTRTRSSFAAAMLALLLLCALAPSPGRGQTHPAAPLQLRVVGGLAGINQYQGLEEPFWKTELPRLSGGRITATISPFDRSGMKAQDMLQLVRVGVVPLGTFLLSIVEAEDPELNAVDLPALNPDFATLRRNVATYRPRLEQILRERFGVRLLAVYAYPAQALYCAKPFAGLGDLKGRKIRTSSTGQSELFSALGALPVIIPFAGIVDAVKKGVVDCAVTGTLSGAEIGLAQVTTHLHPMAISWGLSVFGANEAAWQALPADARAVIETGLAGLESRIWDSADADTRKGILCNTGSPECGSAQRGAMTLVSPPPGEDALRRKMLETVVLPKWLDRCGDACEAAWAATLGSGAGAPRPVKGVP